MEHLFTVAQARALLPEVRRRAAALVAVRADLAELSLAVRNGEESPLGGRAELKALEARLHEELSWFPDQGLELKGVAPLLLDFPAEGPDGRPALLCWLEGEPELGWWHPAELGFVGRRRLEGAHAPR